MIGKHHTPNYVCLCASVCFDFYWKDVDGFGHFFSMRNGLITAALHTGFSTRTILRRLGMLLSQYLVAMHYGLAATLVKAVEDFLDGPAALEDGSAAAAAEIRRVLFWKCWIRNRTTALPTII